METRRATFRNRLADLDFTMKVPTGFVEAELPPEEHDFDTPHVCAPLALLSSPVALAVITVAARPGYADGTVRDWLTYLCAHHGIRLLSIGPAYVGGQHKNHPAIIATALQEQNGTELVMSLVALEDGGRLVTAHAMCPRELEPSFMRVMETCLHSLELLRHKGPTVNPEDNGGKYDIEFIAPEPPPTPENEAEVVARKRAAARDAALAQAAPLIAQDRFDDAARLVFAADDSAQARVALSELFLAALREQVKRDGKRNPASPRALELYRRTLAYRLSTYPDPHTQDEADRYEKGMDDDRAEIAAVLGYTPS
ncbi:MAG: hypothetical protein HBSAPP03_28850 [Phycisphaerae bacterium]|nr:MAG: hypothetical protein HBSAPP03_28850 [Phycisphaerae bacterium]